MNNIGLLQRLRRLQDRRAGRPRPTADLPHHLQYLSIVARHGGIAVAVHAAAFSPLGRVALYRQTDSCQRRQ